MFKLARLWRLKTVQHGSVLTCRQLVAVNSETVDYSLGIAKDALLRDGRPQEVAGFDLVRLRKGSALSSGRPLSQILMDVELAVRLFVVHFLF